MKERLKSIHVSKEFHEKLYLMKGTNRTYQELLEDTFNELEKLKMEAKK